MESSPNSLVRFCNKLLDTWKRDRQTLLEPRWNRNRAAFECDTDEFDMYAGVWKAYQGGSDRPITEDEFYDKDFEGNSCRDWHSRTFLPISKQKAVALTNLINDQVFRSNRIPFQSQIYPDLYADEAQYAELDERRTKIQDKLYEMLDRTDAVKGFKDCVRTASVYGEGYVRKVVQRVELRSVTKEQGIRTEYKDYLGAEHVSVWDMFRDLQFDDLDDGDGLCQRTFVSIADMQRIVTEEGEDSYWLPDQLKCAVSELHRGSDYSGDNTSVNPRLRDFSDFSSKYEYYEFWVRVPARLAEDFERKACVDIDVEIENEDYLDSVYVLCGVLGNTVIRYARVERGDHPFYRFEFERDPDRVGGISVIDNVVNEQIVLNGMIRSYEDNKKLSSNLILASDEAAFVGDYKDWEPGLDLKLRGRRNINEAIQQFIVADVGDTLVSGIQMFSQFADMSSMIPREQQGMPSNNPQTAFEIQQRLERSGKYVGQIISHLDSVLEDYVNDCYEFLCEDPEFADLGMAFKMTALGFSSYEARALRQQGLMQLMALINQNPEWKAKVNADFFLEESAKSVSIPPSQFVKSDEKLEEEQQQREADPLYQMNMKKMDLEIRKLAAEVKETESEAVLNNAKAASEGVSSGIKKTESLSTTVDPKQNLANELLSTDI